MSLRHPLAESLRQFSDPALRLGGDHAPEYAAVPAVEMSNSAVGSTA